MQRLISGRENALYRVLLFCTGSCGLVCLFMAVPTLLEASQATVPENEVGLMFFLLLAGGMKIGAVMYLRSEQVGGLGFYLLGDLFLSIYLASMGTSAGWALALANGVLALVVFRVYMLLMGESFASLRRLL